MPNPLVFEFFYTVLVRKGIIYASITKSFSFLFPVIIDELVKTIFSRKDAKNAKNISIKMISDQGPEARVFMPEINLHV
jgi:hypothetical protein